MKLWTFLFIDADHPLQSARVAADSRSDACSFMVPELAMARSFLLEPAGLMDVPPGVIYRKARDGRVFAG